MQRGVRPALRACPKAKFAAQPRGSPPHAGHSQTVAAVRSYPAAVVLNLAAHFIVRHHDPQRDNSGLGMPGDVMDGLFEYKVELPPLVRRKMLVQRFGR